MSAINRRSSLRIQFTSSLSNNRGNRPVPFNGEEIVLFFGKHRGKPIKQVDDGHLQWMQATLGSSCWRRVASKVLEQRKQQKKRRKGVLLDELKVCRSLLKGKELHAEAIESGADSCVHVATALVNMYAKCGSILDAREVFEGIKNPDVVSWTALILGYAENGDGATALELFARMKSVGCSPDPFTFAAALKACTSLASQQDGGARAECLERGRQIHSEIGSRLDSYVQSALIGMYTKCGSMMDARRVFEGMKNPSVVAWTALISGYAENGEGSTALDLFARMRSQGFALDSVICIAALKACTSLALKQHGSARAECLARGRGIHSEISCRMSVHLQNTLIDMYAACGSMTEAQAVFVGIKHPDSASWNALIAGYAENGQGVTALDLFSSMKFQGFVPDSFTYVAVLKACSLLGALESGSKIHAEIAGAQLKLSVILVTSLVDFYAKCGCLAEAHSIFESHPGARNLRTWNALLAGYSRLGESKAALGLFEEIQDAGLQPDGVTFLSVLTCCSHAGLVDKARELLEAMTSKFGVTPGVEHYTCMVDVLGRSNKLDDAVALLGSMPCKADAVTWMTALAACRKWKNVEIGRLAFKSLVSLGDTNAAAYVLMAHIYGSRGMWEEQDMCLVMRKRFGTWKEPGRSSWTNGLGEVHTFLVGDSKVETFCSDSGKSRFMNINRCSPC